MARQPVITEMATLGVYMWRTERDQIAPMAVG